jgi:hypothetical protein
LRYVACALALPKSQQRLSGARAGMQITHVLNFSAPDLRAEHCPTLLEVSKRLGRSPLGKSEPSTGGWDQDRADAGGQALVRKKREKPLRFNKITSLDGDVSQNGNSKRKPRPKITLLQDSQSDSCGRVRFGKCTEPQLQ